MIKNRCRYTHSLADLCRTPCFICHLNVSPLDHNYCSKDPSLHTATLILNRYLPNAFRSDCLIKSFDRLNISQRSGLWVLSTQTSFFILMFSPWTKIVLKSLTFKLCLWFRVLLHPIEITGGKFFSSPTHFCQNEIFGAPFMVFMGNIYINISWNSLFWIQAYQKY